jgi:hypothetical protein
MQCRRWGSKLAAGWREIGHVSVSTATPHGTWQFTAGVQIELHTAIGPRALEGV